MVIKGRPPLGKQGDNKPADGETTEQLVSQALALGDSRETTVLNLLGVELERVLGELETFLDESSELADAAPFLAQDFLGVGCTDDDLVRAVEDRKTHDTRRHVPQCGRG